MERTRRQFWTFTVTAGAVLVIVAAAASGLFQLAVQAVPGYRADVERYVREVTGRPVRIGALDLTWRYTYPSLDLHEVALLADDNRTVLLEAERLRLGFGLLRLLRRNFTPNRLELHGLTLEIAINKAGRVEIPGVAMDLDESAAEKPPQEVLRPLTAFEVLRLQRCRLNVRDERRRGETWSFGLSYAELSRGLLGTTLESELTLPASVGDSARVEASLQGDWLDVTTWTGDWTLELAGLAAGSWLTPYLAKGASLEFNEMQLAATGELQRGRLEEMDLALRSGPVRARRASHKAGVDSLEAELSVEFADEGWNARLNRLELGSANGRWPSATAEVRASGWSNGQPREDAAYEGRMEFLRLADLAPWLQMVRVPSGWLTLDNLAGELHDTQFKLQGQTGDWRYTVRTRFAGVALPAAGHAAGIAGLGGELAADESGGRMILREGPAQLELPGMLDTPAAAFEKLSGEFEWRRKAAAWQLEAPQFQWALLGTRGSGRLELLLPDDKERSPELNLDAQFQSDDVTQAKPLMPKHWGGGLKNWLDRSIISGRAPRGTLKIAGPLADFPFIDKPGTWELDIEAADILLAFQPDWPPIEQLGAQLRFRGNSLDIVSTQGVINGNPVRKVTARFPDFKTADLIIDGTVQGETARFYEFLSNSPLRDDLAGLLATTASGPAVVDVHIDIPLREAKATQASGRVLLEGIELRHRSLTEPFRDIRGQVMFGGPGVRSEGLAARWYEMPIVATLAPHPGGGSLLTAGLTLAVDAEGRGASALVPGWLRKKLAGESRWRAELVMGGTEQAPVKLSTDMVGLEVQLPPPAGKPAQQAIPLVLTVGDRENAPLAITVDYQDRFGASLNFAQNRGSTKLQSAALRLGSGPLIPALEPGMILGGAVSELDLQAWSAALKGMGLGGELQSLKRVDVHLGRAQWGRMALRDTRYQWTPEGAGWKLSLAGTGAAGELTWDDQGQGALSARLDQLALDFADAPASESEPVDPKQMPVLDLDVRKLGLNQADLGHVTLVTERSELGQKLKVLKADGGTLNLSGGGEWRRRARQSSATLDFDFGSKDIAALLRAAHYTPTLDAKSSKLKGTLSWAPSPDGLEWQQARGTVALDFENGQLRAVEPGAGRVLGLLNFYALPRRLTLNFRDVVSSGLGFDRIRGDFALGDGQARTENLQISGPSLRMDMRGRIGLAARDYDQSVTVYPDVSAGVTLGALALGGPVAGVLTLIAQELLKKPLNQVTQLSYRVTGSWDNPQVERASEPPAPEPAARPAGSPPQKP